MLSPSDFNNAVPKFTNGNYASNPLNPQYIAEPSSTDYNRGVEPLQTLPAQWWNWFLNKFTGRFNKVNIYVKNIFNELAQILSIFNITPDGTEATPTTSQLKTIFACCYPEYVKTTACLVGTETTVNGHPLTGNVTVTRSDLGLGTSATVNTGTAVGCIPTVGTALGTTNNNILVTDATGKLKPSGITVDTAVACPLGTASAGVATTVARSDHVHPLPSCIEDKYDEVRKIGIGYGGTSLTSAQIAHIAAYSTNYEIGCTVIKDVTRTELWSWLCLGSAACYSSETFVNVGGGQTINGSLTACCFCGALCGVAEDACRSFYIRDYGDSRCNVFIGYAGSGLTSLNITQLAGYCRDSSNNVFIKDISLSETWNWLSNCVANATVAGAGYATSAGSATTAGSASSLSYTGTGSTNVSTYQSNLSYFGSPEEWASYLIFNHGDGSTYFHQMLRMPFDGVPQYQRMQNGNLSGWQSFVTTENISCACVCYATSAGRADSATNAFGLISQPLTADIHQPVYRDGNDIINNSNRPILFWKNCAGSTVFHARIGTNPGELTDVPYSYALV